MKPYLLLLLAVLFIFSCTKNERSVVDFEDNWTFLVATSALELKIVNQKGTIMNQDIYKEKNGKTLPSEPSAMYTFRDNIYILMPKIFKIEVIDKASYAHVATIDFSTNKYQPAAMCFPNATTAYVAQGNSNVVSVLDITNFAVARNLTVGQHPVSIAVPADSITGNQVVVANQQDNSISIIDTRIPEVTSTFQIDAAPSYVDIINGGKRAVIVCLGEGKLITGNKSNAMVSLYDLETKEFVFTKELGTSSIKAIDQFPVGICCTNTNFAYITTKDNLFRFDDKSGNVTQIKKDIYNGICFNPRRYEIMVLKNGKKQLSSADINKGSEILTISLPKNVVAVLPI